MDETKRIGSQFQMSAVTQSSTTQSSSTQRSSAKTGAASGTKAADPNKLDRTDFLNILVQQLKNQDPLEPMKNEEFAVNLAQFSQLEQLININNTLTGGGNVGGGDVSSLAGYLGHEVLLSDNTLSFSGGSSDSLALKLPQDASGLILDVTKAGTSGEAQRIPISGLSKGSHTISLSNLGVADGDYTFSVKGVSSGGAEFPVDSSVVGTVSGFIPGADPKLVVGDREVNPSSVKEVRLPSG
jgi:flagellar basal-body rod modification protein FlgD